MVRWAWAPSIRQPDVLVCFVWAWRAGFRYVYHVLALHPN